jgi:hypothetical protein
MIFARRGASGQPRTGNARPGGGRRRDVVSDRVDVRAADGRPAEPATVAGPYDITVAPPGRARLDFGALKVPAIDGVEARLQRGDGGTQQVVIGYARSTLQLSVVAAPRSEAIWTEVLGEIRQQLPDNGFAAEEIHGDYGVELRARVDTPRGPTDIRFVGIGGPRWLLRAVFQGPAAVDPATAPPLLDCLRNLVVDRGHEPMPVREPLPLHPPTDMAGVDPAPDTGVSTRRCDTTVQLPVGQPAASTYQFFAYPLAILATDARASDWVLSNFIQLEYDNRGWHTDVPLTFYLYDYAASPWLEVVRGTRRWFGPSEICNVIRDGLAAGYYAYVVVDEYFVPRRRFHRVRHQSRDILVHGVDGDAGEFTVLGFDEQMRFRSTRVGVDTFQRAYSALDGHGMENAPVLFYRPRAEPEFGYPQIEYGLNLALIRQTVDEYLHSADTSAHFQMLRVPRPCTYGVAVYEPLEGFLRSFAAGELRYDPRHLAVLWEHKHLMAQRVLRLSEVLGPSASMEEQAARIEQTASRLRKGMARTHIQGGRSGFLDRALRMLEQLREDEADLMTRLLRRME